MYTITTITLWVAQVVGTGVGRKENLKIPHLESRQ